jgi:hypothetical protein
VAYRSVSVDVDVDISEFSDEAIVGEAIDRGYSVAASTAQIEKLKGRRKCVPEGLLVHNSNPWEMELTDIREALLERRVDDAMVILDRVLNPKFKHAKDCQEKYEKARVKPSA